MDPPGRRENGVVVVEGRGVGSLTKQWHWGQSPRPRSPPMPSPTCPPTPGPSDSTQGSKRAASETELTPQRRKKPRRNPSADSGSRRDSNRDSKRRKRKKRKTPIVNTPAHKDDLSPVTSEPSRPCSQLIRLSSPPLRLDQTNMLPDAKDVAHAYPTQTQEADTSHHLHEPVSLSSPAYESATGSSLEDKVTKLEAELKSKNDLIASHRALLGQVQQAVTCQVCLDLMYKAYALAPCGHLACYGCLVNWFNAPPPDNRPATPAIRRRKACPHCRAVVRERPIELWGVKSISQAVGKSGLLPNQLPVPADAPENLGANVDPWKDIFPKPGATGHQFPWFFPGVDIDDEDDIDIADGVPRGEDVGMLDMEDGGIYRCLDCMHEIWDGVCTSCGRVYSGHRPGGDDEDFEENPMGWLEDQMVSEEVDIADDPGWMGLEDGEADDDGGDVDDWLPFPPWQRQLNVFHGPWGYFGAIQVDEEDEEDVYDRVGDLRLLDGEESEDDAYESSFIDDGDVGGYLDGPRFHEIDDVEGYDSSFDVADERAVVSSDGEGGERGYGDDDDERVAVSSDGEDDERAYGSDDYWSDR